MLANSNVNTFTSVQIVGQSFGGTPGVSVVPGASSSEGSWTTWATASTDVYGVFVRVSAGATASQVRQHLLDIGVDASGGVAYTPVISNIVCGNAAGIGQGGHSFYFPFLIKAGSTIAVRVQTSNATAGTVRVYGHLYGKPTRPELVWAGSYSETLGVTTGSQGTVITPGTSAVGSWVSLGTTTRNLKYWQVGMQWSAAPTAARAYGVDLAYGDGTNMNMILDSVRHMVVVNPAPSSSSTQLHPEPLCYADVPAGSTIYTRAWCTNAPSPTGAAWNVTAVGIGG